MIVAQDRVAEVLKLTRRGFTQTQIARRIGITRQCVNKILAASVKRTAKEIDKDRAHLIAQHVDKIDESIREAYGEWERSKQEAKKETSKLGENEKGGTFEIVEAKEWQCGDPRYLAVIIKALDQRAKILALFPEKQQANETNVNVNVGVSVTTALENLSDDQLVGYLHEAGSIARAGAPALEAGTDPIDLVSPLSNGKATPVPEAPES